MKAITRRAATALAALAAGLPFALSGGGRAADYPARPVRIIVGFATGSTADTPARLLAQAFGDALRQPFIVENKPGAGSNVAAEYVARAPNDGYTLLLATTAQTTYAGMTVDPAYDPTRDFTPIVRIAAVSNMVVANPSFPADDLKALIALAKEKPDRIFFATGGVGTVAHLAGELINMMAGIRLVHVPYPGSAQAMTDAVSGRVPLWIAPASAAVPQVAAGKLKAIAVTTAQRATIAPDVPTVAEAGLAGYDLGLWYGLLAPAGTPQPIVDRLAQIADATLRTPELGGALRKLGMDPVGGTPEQFARYIGAETDKATAVATAANIRK